MSATFCFYPLLCILEYFSRQSFAYSFTVPLDSYLGNLKFPSIVLCILNISTFKNDFLLLYIINILPPIPNNIYYASSYPLTICFNNSATRSICCLLCSFSSVVIVLCRYIKFNLPVYNFQDDSNILR